MRKRDHVAKKNGDGDVFRLLQIVQCFGDHLLNLAMFKSIGNQSGNQAITTAVILSAETLLVHA
jgi:hypothetical protein